MMFRNLVWQQQRSRCAIVGRWLSDDGKKLPQELRSMMRDDWGAGLSYMEAMKNSMQSTVRSRLPSLTREDLGSREQGLYDTIVESRSKTGKAAGFDIKTKEGVLFGPWNAMVACSPDIGESVERMARACRHENSCPSDLYECGILVIAAHRRSEFEWFAHEKIALNLGIHRQTIDDIREHNFLSPRQATRAQRALILYAHELDSTHRVSDDTHTAALEALEEIQSTKTAPPIKQLLDFVWTIGLYSQIAFILNAFKIPLPPGQEHSRPSFPPLPSMHQSK